MPKQELQHNGAHDKSTDGHAQAATGHEQKLHEDAYQKSPHSPDAKTEREQEEKLKVERTKELMLSFKHKDANHDGKLTVDEIVNYDQESVKKAMASYTKSTTKSEMAALDSNHDGEITLKEFEKGNAWRHVSLKQLEAEFKARDTNGDGHITFTELKNYNSKQNEGFQKDVLKAVEKSDRENFKLWDVNHDGKLSLAEYLAPNIEVPMALALGAAGLTAETRAAATPGDAVSGGTPPSAAAAEAAAPAAGAVDNSGKPAKAQPHTKA